MDEYDEGVRYFETHPLIGRDMWIASADIKIHVTDVWLECGEVYIGGNVGNEAFYALAAAARTAIGAGAPYTLPAATTSVNGGVKKMVAQADSTATDVAGLLADFNAFLAKARTAGLM